MPAVDALVGANINGGTLRTAGSTATLNNCSTSTSGAKPASIVLLCQVPLASRSSSLSGPDWSGPQHHEDALVAE